MSLPKTIFQGKDSSLIEVLYTRGEIAFRNPDEIVSLDSGGPGRKDGSSLANPSAAHAPQ